jgi:hypothetical protein
MALLNSDKAVKQGVERRGAVRVEAIGRHRPHEDLRIAPWHGPARGESYEQLITEWPPLARWRFRNRIAPGEKSGSNGTRVYSEDSEFNTCRLSYSTRGANLPLCGALTVVDDQGPVRSCEISQSTRVEAP